MDGWLFNNVLSTKPSSSSSLSLFFHPLLSASCTDTFGARGGVVVKALCYKPEVRGFNT
jgi:hypothetical protein